MPVIKWSTTSGQSSSNLVSSRLALLAKKINVIALPIRAKADAIGIDELKKVIAKPAPKPDTAEMVT